MPSGSGATCKSHPLLWQSTAKRPSLSLAGLSCRAPFVLLSVTSEPRVVLLARADGGADIIVTSFVVVSVCIRRGSYVFNDISTLSLRRVDTPFLTTRLSSAFVPTTAVSALRSAWLALLAMSVSSSDWALVRVVESAFVPTTVVRALTSAGLAFVSIFASSVSCVTVNAWLDALLAMLVSS